MVDLFMRYLFLIIFVTSSTAWAEKTSDTAQQWLEKMLYAASNSNYQGIMIYGDSHTWNSLHIIHAVIDGQEYEKMLYLTGEPREFIRRGNQLMCIQPDASFTKLNKKLNQNPITKNWSQSLMQVQTLYSIKLQKQERIAGRQAQKIRLTPKDSHRYGYQLWLDTDSALLLRSDMLANNTLLERFQFAQIKIGIDLPAMLFKPTSKGKLTQAHINPNSAAPQMPNNNWQLTWLPKGFERTSNNIQRASRTSYANKQMYSDGLSAFSVFVETEQHTQPEVQQQWGATAAAIVYKPHTDKLYKITIVGELPMHSIKKIAHSIVFTPN